LFIGNTVFIELLFFVRYDTLQDLFINNKTVCFHDTLANVMEREYPTSVDNFLKSSASDIERIVYVQNDDQCDGVVISRFSLSLVSTQIKSCKHLYPLFDEELFTQDVIVAISQTLGELGDELVNVMDMMSSKRLYLDRHDEYSSPSEECSFDALGEPKGVVWESFLTPFIFSIGLAGIAFIIWLVWKARKGAKPINRSVHIVTKDGPVLVETDSDAASLRQAQSRAVGASAASALSEVRPKERELVVAEECLLLEANMKKEEHDMTMRLREIEVKREEMKREIEVKREEMKIKMDVYKMRIELKDSDPTLSKDEIEILLPLSFSK